MPNPPQRISRDLPATALPPTAPTAVPLLPATASIATAVPRDLTYVTSLQKRYSNQLGFLPTAALTSLIDDGRVMIARENGDPTAYVVSRRQLRCQKWTASIVQTAVQMDAQRRRIGESLVEAVCQDAWADGRSIVQAWCREDLDACDFWDACGFTAVATRDPGNVRGKLMILFRRLLPGADKGLLSILPRRAGAHGRLVLPEQLVGPPQPDPQMTFAWDRFDPLQAVRR